MDRLRKRRDFLAAAKARRAGVGCFLMQGRDRGDAGEIRVGFTVTKKIGNAVVRNRIRRRLREAVRQVLPAAGRPGFDYVLVARELALTAPFEGLVRDLDRAVTKLHAPAEGAGPSGGRQTGKNRAGKNRPAKSGAGSSNPEKPGASGKPEDACAGPKAEAIIPVASSSSLPALNRHPDPLENQLQQSDMSALASLRATRVRPDTPTAADGGLPA